ncbi:Sensor histidine kinase LiaS [Nonomuraea coxensis DSM 45129]|uniref:Sensor histidine kinase LiaS n=1 Tax=Nonomuraea coxensis DSM 45129 TaxID=1122611 RepID=A0ABX8U0F2_9ACTN|nr:ATP-binding protein [Nonomuraea coxensis]QYC40441.1 Sensor histidine kinase LiaS [Nonomuraea coxensis DSM 45129]
MRGGQSLAEALESYLAEWGERSGIAVETWALPAGDVPASVSAGVMTAMREALDNVERHSGARTVSIAVTAGSGGVRVTVSDDGHGFPATGSATGPVTGSATGQAVGGGHGIARMRAAFAEVGGSLSVNSVPGEGTTVTGVVPRRP